MAHKTREDAAAAMPSLFQIEIKRAELTPDISKKDNRYIIKIRPHER